ncbi:succinate dehydrogenase, hydrophobic membrane anchor protein [Elongatibacter sediminis]|uniref:Succinate dehydrogenase hydrophobic membrane anchor subunit n=1 Tax=Elongatibacter sediminis TaxID=3119006 RepID=A0AAW9RL90_9GAMM
MSAFRHPLARARGHGSAGGGVHHWIAQRISAVLLLILIPWAVYALVSLGGATHAEAAAFVGRPWNATGLILLVLTLLYHATLGLQVVIEDYVHRRAVELTLHFAVRALALTGAVFGVVHILKLTLGS